MAVKAKTCELYLDGAARCKRRRRLIF